MSEHGPRWPLALGGALGLVASGVAIGYGLFGSTAPPAGVPTEPAAAHLEHAVDGAAPAAAAPHDHASMPASEEHPGDVVVSLTPDMAARAGIATTEAMPGDAVSELRLPGVVQANAYKEVVVTSLVSGRVTQVQAELGAQVMAQDPLTIIYSPELAEAQTAFIAARAEQLAHQSRQTRTQRLTAIGAATREELEQHEADRARVDAEVEVARARLVLLGIPEERTQRLTGPQDVVTTIPIRSPLSGVITRRTANVGLNIDPSTPLFTVSDLSTVWVIVDLYERDFSRVRVGSPATVTSAAYPGVVLRGRVSYIDPQVQQETRTAKLRVEVPNASGRLRLGMYVDAHIGDMTVRKGVLVPKTALQVAGPDTVVYVADRSQPGRFIERKVETGDASGDQVLVLTGLRPGDPVVIEGVFFLRAERERMQQ